MGAAAGGIAVAGPIVTTFNVPAAAALTSACTCTDAHTLYRKEILWNGVNWVLTTPTNAGACRPGCYTGDTLVTDLLVDTDDLNPTLPNSPRSAAQGPLCSGKARGSSRSRRATPMGPAWAKEAGRSRSRPPTGATVTAAPGKTLSGSSSSPAAPLSRRVRLHLGQGPCSPHSKLPAHGILCDVSAGHARHEAWADQPRVVRDPVDQRDRSPCGYSSQSARSDQDGCRGRRDRRGRPHHHDLQRPRRRRPDLRRAPAPTTKQVSPEGIRVEPVDPDLGRYSPTLVGGACRPSCWRTARRRTLTSSIQYRWCRQHPHDEVAAGRVATDADEGLFSGHGAITIRDCVRSGKRRGASSSRSPTTATGSPYTARILSAGVRRRLLLSLRRGFDCTHQAIVPSPSWLRHRGAEHSAPAKRRLACSAYRLSLYAATSRAGLISDRRPGSRTDPGRPA